MLYDGQLIMRWIQTSYEGMEDASFLNNKGILEECLGPGCSEHDLPKGVGQRQFSNSPPPMRRMVKESLGSGCSQHRLPKVVDPSWFHNLPGWRIVEENLGPGCS